MTTLSSSAKSPKLRIGSTELVAFIRYAITANLILAYFGLGLCLNIPGPTLLDLERAVNTDIEQLSILFTVRSVGFMFGSLLVAVVVDRFDRHILMMIALTIMGVTTSSVPWTYNLLGICCVIVISGASMGFIETGSNVICMSLWGHRSGPVLQMTHAAYGLGSIVSALIAEPFLAPSEPVLLQHNTTSTFQNIHTNSSSSLDDSGVSEQLHSFDTSVTCCVTSKPWFQDPRVFVKANPVIGCYAIIGAVSIFTAGSFLGVRCLMTRSGKKANAFMKDGNDNSDSRSDTRPLSGKTTITLVILTSTFLCLQAGMETSLGHFLSTFSVTSDLQLTKSTGSYLTSAYWGSYTIYGLVSAVRATRCRSQHSMYFDLVLLLITNVTMCFFGDTSLWAVWIGTVLLGCGNSPVFATAYTFFSEFVPITSKEASVFVAATSFGEMTFPWFTGQLIKQESKVLFYQNTFGTVLCSAVFIATHVVATRKVKRVSITKISVTESPDGIVVRDQAKSSNGVYQQNTTFW